MVYIAEAHAVDEWPMGDGFGVSPYTAIRQPKSVTERCDVAKFFQKEMKCEVPLVIDGPGEEAFECQYSVWPLRFYIVHEGKVVYKAQPTNNYRYSVPDLVKNVEAVVAKAFPSEEMPVAEPLLCGEVQACA